MKDLNRYRETCRRMAAESPLVEASEKEVIRASILAAVCKGMDEVLERLEDGQKLVMLFDLRIVYPDGTLEEESVRTSKRAKEWRKAVFERDDYTCQKCGSRGGRIQAHHLEEWARCPSKRFEVSNGQTLCVTCHAEIHPEQGNLILKSRYHIEKK